MTAPSDIIQYGPLEVHVVSLPKTDEYMIEGFGFTRQIVSGDNPFQLLPEDPMRYQAILTSNGGLHIGSKSEFSSVSGNIPVTGTQPGPRIDGTASPFVIRAQNEIWAAGEGALIVGVWIERRVPRGR